MVSIHELIHVLRKLTAYALNFVFLTSMILNASFPLIQTVLSITSSRRVTAPLESYLSPRGDVRQIRK